MPEISVIMGVYNSQSEYMLRRAINSIRNQTFTDFEFIICNDCSTKSFISDVLKEYEMMDGRIRVINNKTNLGLAASLNHCLQYAKGKYIARQDDDDISLPTRLEKQRDFLDGNQDNYALVSCNIILIDNNGIWGKQNLKEYPKVNDLMYGTTYVHPALMLRKDAMDKVGNYTVKDITKRTEDYDLYMKLAEAGYNGKNIQEYLFIYFQGIETYNKQLFKYRIDEYKLKKHWFKRLKLYPKGLIYLIKPLISGICPKSLKLYQKKKKFCISVAEKEKLDECYKKYL